MWDFSLGWERPCPLQKGGEGGGSQPGGFLLFLFFFFLWRGCRAGSTSSEMLKDRLKERRDQLANVCRWGKSCWPCLPKGQGITHVPVPQWKGKFPEACLICLSILNPSLAPSQVWVLVEELKNDAEKAAWQREGPFSLSSIRKARAGMVFAV